MRINIGHSYAHTLFAVHLMQGDGKESSVYRDLKVEEKFGADDDRILDEDLHNRTVIHSNAIKCLRNQRSEMEAYRPISYILCAFDLIYNL